MYAIEFRDEEYDELIEEAQALMKDAHKIKMRACKLLKKLSEQPLDEEGGEEEEEMEEISYRHWENEPMYRKKSYKPSYKRVR